MKKIDTFYLIKKNKNKKDIYLHEIKFQIC